MKILKYFIILILAYGSNYLYCAEKEPEEKTVYKQMPKELYDAIYENNLKSLIDYLNKKPNDVDFTDEYNVTPLIMAIEPFNVKDKKANNIPLILELLSRTKDINKVVGGRTALHTLLLYKPSIQLVQEFIKHGAKLNLKIEKAMLMNAVASQVPKYFDEQPKVVQFLLDNGADVNEVDGEDNNVFLWSINSLNLPVVQLLLNNPKNKFDINYKNNYLYNALHQAIWALHHATYYYKNLYYTKDEMARYLKNFDEIINMLISRGIRIDEPNILKETPFVTAAKLCDYHTINLLAGFNKDFKVIDLQQINKALEEALITYKKHAGDRIEECERVIEFLKRYAQKYKAKKDPNYKTTAEYEKELEKKLAKKSKTEVGHILNVPKELSEIIGTFGVGHKKLDPIKMGRIKKAIEDDNIPELTEFFNNNEKNISLTDEAGDTPLMIAIKLNKKDVVKLILEKLKKLDEIDLILKKDLEEMANNEYDRALRDIFKEELDKYQPSNSLKNQLEITNKNGQNVYYIAQVRDNKEIINLLPKL